MGASAVLAAAWLVTDISYRSAYHTYRGTRLGDLRLDRRDAGSDDVFTQNFERVESRAGAGQSRAGLARRGVVVQCIGSSGDWAGAGFSGGADWKIHEGHEEHEGYRA